MLLVLLRPPKFHRHGGGGLPSNHHHHCGVLQCSWRFFAGRCFFKTALHYSAEQHAANSDSYLNASLFDPV